MSLTEVPSPEEVEAWNALCWDDRVMRITLTKISSSQLCHLGVMVRSNTPVPRTISARGSLAECLNEALVELENVTREGD